MNRATKGDSICQISTLLRQTTLQMRCGLVFPWIGFHDNRNSHSLFESNILCVRIYLHINSVRLPDNTSPYATKSNPKVTAHCSLRKIRLGRPEDWFSVLFSVCMCVRVWRLKSVKLTHLHSSPSICGQMSPCKGQENQSLLQSWNVVLI